MPRALLRREKIDEVCESHPEDLKDSKRSASQLSLALSHGKLRATANCSLRLAERLAKVFSTYAKWEPRKISRPKRPRPRFAPQSPTAGGFTSFLIQRWGVVGLLCSTYCARGSSVMADIENGHKNGDFGVEKDAALHGGEEHLDAVAARGHTATDQYGEQTIDFLSTRWWWLISSGD